jgi:hypothetical protein
LSTAFVGNNGDVSGEGVVGEAERVVGVDDEMDGGV